MSPALLARCCFGYRGGIVHVHVGKPQIVELLIQLFLTVNEQCQLWSEPSFE